MKRSTPIAQPSADSPLKSSPPPRPCPRCHKPGLVERVVANPSFPRWLTTRCKKRVKELTCPSCGYTRRYAPN